MHLKHVLMLMGSVVAVSGAAFAAEFDAELGWSDTYIASFPLDGGVRAVHVRPGDRVDSGQKLIELDSEPIGITVRRYEAELAAREPVLADARREYEQAESLYEQTVLSEVERQRAQLAFEKARAEVSAAKARLAFARWQLQKAVVRAPFDAWVIERNVEPGQMLVDEQRSRRLLVLARRGAMQAAALLPLREAARTETGRQATVTVGDADYAGRVIATGMQPANEDGGARYRIVVEFAAGPEDRLRAGQDAKIILR